MNSPTFWPNEFNQTNRNPIMKDPKQDSGFEDEEHKTQMKVKPEIRKDTRKTKWLAGFKVDPDDPYLWLEDDDPRREMTNRQILEKFVDLSDSILTERGKKDMYDVMLKCKDAFSLRDKIGECKTMEIEIELTNKEPFFIRPYPCKGEHKKLIDKEMRKGVIWKIQITM